LLSRLGPRGSLSRLLVTSSIWSVVLRLGGAALTFVVGVQLARYLKPEGLGVYGVALAVSVLLTAFAQLGLPMLATREVAVARSGSDWAKLRGVLFWFACAVLACGAALGLLYALAVTLTPPIEPELRAASYWAAALVPVMGLTILLNAELRALDRIIKGQALEIVVRPGGMCLLLLLLFLWQGRMSAPEAMAINFAASAGAMLAGFLWLKRALPREARTAPRENHVRAWVAAGVPLAITEVLRQLDSAYGVLVLGAMTTLVETGIFRVAASSVVMLALPLSVLHVVVGPTLARLRHEGRRRELQHLLSLSAGLMFGAALIGTLFVALFGEWLIVLLFGAEYGPAWLPLLLLCLGQCVSGFFGLAFLLLGVGGGEKELARAFFAGILVSVCGAVLVAPAWGATGVAGAAVVGAVVNNGLCAYYVWREMGLSATPLGLFRRDGDAAAGPDSEGG
jgi:O-antigen/teichoic acid export membrane protein